MEDKKELNSEELDNVAGGSLKDDIRRLEDNLPQILEIADPEKKPKKTVPPGVIDLSNPPQDEQPHWIEPHTTDPLGPNGPILGAKK